MQAATCPFSFSGSIAFIRLRSASIPRNSRRVDASSQRQPGPRLDAVGQQDWKSYLGCTCSNRTVSRCFLAWTGLDRTNF